MLQNLLDYARRVRNDRHRRREALAALLLTARGNMDWDWEYIANRLRESTDITSDEIDWVRYFYTGSFAGHRESFQCLCHPPRDPCPIAEVIRDPLAPPDQKQLEMAQCDLLT